MKKVASFHTKVDGNPAEDSGWKIKKHERICFIVPKTKKSNYDLHSVKKVIVNQSEEKKLATYTSKQYYIVMKVK